MAKSRNSGVTSKTNQATQIRTPPPLPPQQQQQAPQQVAVPANLQQDEDDFHIANAQDEANILAVNQAYDRAMRAAQTVYRSQQQDAAGYTPSQNMNHVLALQGPQALDPQQAQVYSTLMQNMKPLGSNLILNRATHSGIIDKILRQAGVSGGYQTLSDSRLNSMLTGVEYNDDKFVSTAWDVNRNPFISGAPSGGREVYMNIKAPSWTPYIVGDKYEAECVLKPGLRYRITGAHYDNTIAYPRNGGAKKRIIVDCEIIP